jgi:hypothetical protein
MSSNRPFMAGLYNTKLPFKLNFSNRAPSELMDLYRASIKWLLNDESDLIYE